MLIDRISDPDHLPPLRVVRSGIASGHRLRGAVIALGNFDGFHRGHRHLIARAQQIGAGQRPVAVMSVEPHPRAFFGKGALARLALPGQKHSMARMLGLDFIYEPPFDHAFAALTPAEFVQGILSEGLGVRQIVVGADFRFGAGRVGDVALLAQLAAPLGIAVTTVPLLGDHSSTGIREALSAGDIPRAARGLGRYWEAVVERDAQGVRLAPALVRPPAGQYVVADPVTGTTHQMDLSAEGALSGLPTGLDRVLLLRRA
ncbi:hypothetical protein [Neotabrizicola sp. VNH66]|uniref:hypothetical protein n=1 Tax=Neotabrizicola sp. VNH66 TaxID=3400918 RepID=UPI003BFD766C